MKAELLESVCRHWGLSKVSVELVAARENQVFKVESAHRALALRIHRAGYRTVAEIESELLWMDMLARHGLAIPAPVKALDGSTMHCVNGVVVDLLTWLDGAPLSRLEVTEDLYHQLGGLLAQMHILADQWTAPEQFSRPVWNLLGDNPSWGRFWDNPLLSNRQRSVFCRFRESALAAIESTPDLDSGLIHADLVPDNVLYNGRQLQLIDFDDGGYGYRLFDLATITRRSRRDDASGSLANAAIAGYRDVRQVDISTLPLFEAIRACTYVGWNITRMDEPGGYDRNERFIREAEHAIDCCQKAGQA